MTIRELLAWAVAGAAFSTAAAALEMPSRPWHGDPSTQYGAVAFRAPGTPVQSIALPEMLEKAAEAPAPDDGRLRVGSVRALPKAADVRTWTPVRDGFVAALQATSPNAAGIRVRLDLSALAAPVEVRVQGANARIETMTLQPGATQAWGPWTEGETQRIELFSTVPPPQGAIQVGALVHFTMSPLAKVAGECTIGTQCSTGDAALDAAIAERKKSIMRLNFVDNGSAVLCSATLINTGRFPEAYVLTAHHCVNSEATASSITSWWFYESPTCADAHAAPPDTVQVAGGMQLMLANYNVDSSLLRMNGTPPAGAVYSGWSASRLANGAQVVSLSHPTGDTSRYALGSIVAEYRVVGHPQDMYGVRFNRGIIQSGSSGSGLFTLTNGSLQMRAILSGSTVRAGSPMSCTNLGEDGLYGRFDIFMPQVAPFIQASAVASDDAPNRVQDVTADAAGGPLNARGSAVVIEGRRLDYAGDLDVYRFTLTQPAVVSISTEGANLDTVGALLDAVGDGLEAEDDANGGNNHFGITRALNPGTYHVQVGHFEPNGTGAYNLRLRADNVERVNHTALWWNESEPGWGLNVNHQGNTVFATLFTYDESGSPLWLVMSSGNRQADNSYQGSLFVASGPPFNASPWSAATLTEVGSMRIMFIGSNVALLTYTYNGVQVTKSLTRQRFGPATECTWSAFDRAHTDNVQDLWWNASEPGWGVNLTHQGDVVFATLFTYDASRRAQWYVMSRGDLTGLETYSGPLYRMAGPAFNASPWTGATPTQVGTMSVRMHTGNSATLTYTINGVQVTKQIERQVFGDLKPACDS